MNYFRNGKLLLKKDTEQDKPFPADLSEIEKDLMKALSNEPIHIDKLSQLVGRTTAETLSLLLPLEFNDLVKQLPGKLFVKVELC